MVDYSNAIAMYVPEENVFVDQNNPRWVVIHKTADPGSQTAQQIAEFFAHNPAMKSSHYVVGLDGTIVQCVAEKDGAGANCCLEAGHDSFWPTNINLNLVTISIEHVDPTPDNSTPLTPEQRQASFLLVADICRRHRIPAENIVGHHSLDPISRARCPGNYPMEELQAFVNGDIQMGVPINWRDDGTTLIAPNGMPVIRGFRWRVLQGWDPNNLPLEAERQANPVEHANPGVGAGSIQTFMNCRLGWTPAKGVYFVPVGGELLYVESH